ncbi:protein SUPPRESSOR OF NPR1-1 CONSTITUTIVE 4 isoform X4 [Capsella rubella]|nr:protein SUPPRESSOR OF NPR1-1 CONSTITUTIVE 4 isoform X4 [Capsella rubella]
MCIESKGVCGYNQTSTEFICYCKDGTYGNTCVSEKKVHGAWNKAIRIVAGTVAGVVLFLVLLTLFLRFLRKREKRLRHQKLKALIPLEHYTYTQVKRITKSFAEVVGTGGFGIVYRGTLRDGRMVAVKVLKDSKGNGEDFINEVASMSRTSHHNIVSLLGFCSEGSKRAIIYEFLGNGSLDKFISGKSTVEMDWGSLYRIALGVARGLEYLHHGCKTRIVHFDIKPQNVLLDDNFCPKVSDFGLAKLCEKQESILSMLDTRGTVGYIAPEMISRVYGNVSHKSDVYSYGMLVLDMIGARNKENFNQAAASNTSSMYFPEWVYKDLELGKSKTNIEIEFNSEEDELAKKMTLVGLWCIQPSPTDRPPMNRVVEMMEGSLDALEVPPRPVFQIPTVSLQESSTFSEDTSTYTEG